MKEESKKDYSFSEPTSKANAEQVDKEQIFNSSDYNDKQELVNLKKEFAKFQLEQAMLQNKIIQQSEVANNSQTKSNFP